MTAEQKENLRMAVLNFLAIRHVAAFNAVQVADRLRAERKVDFQFSDEDMAETCELLLKLGLVQNVVEVEFAVVPHYQATGKGVVTSEKWRRGRGMS